MGHACDHDHDTAPPDAANAADCEKPIVGMRVKALQLEDLKVRAVSRFPPPLPTEGDKGVGARRRNGAHGCSRKTQIRRRG